MDVQAVAAESVVEITAAEYDALQAIREAAWNVVIDNQPVLLGTTEDALYWLLCHFDHDYGVPLSAVATS